MPECAKRLYSNLKFPKKNWQGRTPEPVTFGEGIRGREGKTEREETGGREG